MNRDRALHSLEKNTVEVPSLIFFVETLGTFRSQAAEDLRVYVRGQKMTDSLDLGRSQNILCFKNTEEGCIIAALHYFSLWKIKSLILFYIYSVHKVNMEQTVDIFRKYLLQHLKFTLF